MPFRKSKRRIAYIATTVRNKDTYRLFHQCLSEYSSFSQIHSWKSLCPMGFCNDDFSFNFSLSLELFIPSAGCRNTFNKVRNFYVIRAFNWFIWGFPSRYLQDIILDLLPSTVLANQSIYVSFQAIVNCIGSWLIWKRAFLFSNMIRQVKLKFWRYAV